MQPITITYPFRPQQRSLATARVATLFGLDADPSPYVVADQFLLDLRPDDLALFTGPSGSGKSPLLRAVGRQGNALDAGSLALPDLPLVDALAGPVEARLDRLAACGLSEARLLLRTPEELSDGQRYRFRLAYALARVSAPLADSGRGETGPQHFVLADEFCAVLDRTLAKVLAFNVRKLASRSVAGFLLATPHDDLLDDLNPDLHVRCRGDGQVEVERRSVKKKRSSSPTTCGSPTAPSPTGRTSLGGITAATTSP